MKLWDQWGRELVFFDGAMGTMLQKAGLPQGKLPECWNIERPAVIRDIHAAYLAAGCQVVKTNTFGANRPKISQTTYTVEQVVTKGVELAREAVEGCGHTAYVAMDIGPTGRLLAPLGDLEFDEACSIFGEMAEAGESAGADLILIETMSDTYEMKAAVLGAKEATKLPIVATMIFDQRGKLLTGGDVETVVTLLEGLGVDALGINCGMGPGQMKGLLEELLRCSSLPIVMNPNAGLPHCVDGCTSFDVGPAEFAETMRELARMGAWAVGGCCGTTPDHLRETVRRCRDVRPVPLVRKNRTVVSSYAHTVVLGDRPVIIGERINPTGKSRFKQALRENDMDYIVEEGIKQQENGAHILDVNVGLPEIDETACMVQAVRELQSVINLPLQIDTSNVETMEAALRAYNGKPLINSVSGKQESMETIFPLVKKYGGVVVALTLDEQGIPETAEGRLEIARHIIETAAQYGIDKKNILVDTLTMAVSACPDAANVTLKALRLVREQLGVGTVLGVSNVSFGLPRRELLNATFYTLALENGLSAAIINPNAPGMMQVYRSYNALMGGDPQCERYIAAYAEAQPAEKVPMPTAVLSLYDAIIQGIKEKAFAAAVEQVKTRAPLDIIHEELIPALDVVGQGFEKGTLFLPQLLMSAEAAKAAFEAVKSHLTETGQNQVKKEKILLATVKGDIHDIGKNIVKILLENYSYDVVDLGKDVDPDLIVKTVLEQHIRLVGLSALMTTTVSSMADTIDRLHRKAPDCHIMVGGAVLTQEYADQIGADFYSKDAMASVYYAQQLFGKE